MAESLVLSSRLEDRYLLLWRGLRLADFAIGVGQSIRFEKRNWKSTEEKEDEEIDTSESGTDTQNNSHANLV